MHVKTYHSLPQCAMDIRITVFVEEQGFRDELDEIDGIAVHLVMFDGEKPIATCRIFQKEGLDSYFLGRLAVIREYRSQGIGAKMLDAGAEYVRAVGGSELLLHAQCRAKGFYEKCGYIGYGEIEYEEDCPHIWMKKTL